MPAARTVYSNTIQGTRQVDIFNLNELRATSRFYHLPVLCPDEWLIFREVY